MFRSRTLTRLLLPVCLALLPMGRTQAAAVPAKAAKQGGGVTVTRLNWHGWPDALRVSNGLVEAIVVPSIGRIMAFEFVNAPQTSPIFCNPEWAGKSIADADPTTWAAFGGDKLWPSPQAEWPQHNVRGWPPDQTFDGDPEIAQILPNGVRLITPDSTAFAAHATRVITMKPGQARLYIAQTLIKDADARNPPTTAAVPDEIVKTPDPNAAPAVVEAQNAAARQKRDGFLMGIWSITQTRGDETVFLPLSKNSQFPGGYVGLDDPGTIHAAPYFTTQAGLLRITRDPKNSRKVGAASPQGWMASLYDSRILFSEHFVYQPGSVYPDGGTPTEVYTNPGPAYIEMELLGPLVSLTHGGKITHDIFWQLQRLPRVPRSRAEAQALVTAALH